MTGVQDTHKVVADGDTAQLKATVRVSAGGQLAPVHRDHRAFDGTTCTHLHDLADEVDREFNRGSIRFRRGLV
jgi:hypothetical protein